MAGGGEEGGGEKGVDRVGFEFAGVVDQVFGEGGEGEGEEGGGVGEPGFGGGIDEREGGATEQEGKEAEGEFVVAKGEGKKLGEGGEAEGKDMPVLERAGEDLGKGFMGHGVGEKGFIEPEGAAEEVLAKAEGDAAEDEKGRKKAGDHVGEWARVL